MKLWGFISMGFHVTDQLLVRYLSDTGEKMGVHKLFVDFKKAYDSVRRGVMYSILIQFGVHMKLVRLMDTI
jgi:hypothetical protein